MSLSLSFLLLLAVLVPLYFAYPKRWQSAILLAGSLVFYAFAGWQALLVLALLTTATYTAGRLIGRVLTRQNNTLAVRRADGSWDKTQRKAYRAREQRRVRAWLTVGVCFDAVVLLAFKLSLPARLGLVGWTLPMGLSFVTLSAIGYLFDVAREQIACERNFGSFALFIFYFPQLWQGPISRYGELAPQLAAPHVFDGHRVTEGAVRALWGCVKKLVIADTAAVATAAILTEQQTLGGAGMIVLIVVYTLQIYADFTGGMDISLGISHALGVTLFENFDAPFAAPSLGEYWRRWHRSLGRFFTDYVFYPVSVSRPVTRTTALARRYVGEAVARRVPLYTAMLITWLLTGLWHGASWNFIVWGLLNGAILLLSRELRPLRERLGRRTGRIASSRPWHAALCAGTLLLTGLLRTLDLNGHASVTLSLWARMFTADVTKLFERSFWSALGLNGAQWVLLGLGTALMWAVSRMTPRVGEAKALPLRTRLAARPVLCAIVCALGVVAVLIFGRYGVGYDATDFIYGQF